jgi:hypothetical protein
MTGPQADVTPFANLKSNMTIPQRTYRSGYRHSSNVRRRKHGRTVSRNHMSCDAPGYRRARGHRGACHPAPSRSRHQCAEGGGDPNCSEGGSLAYQRSQCQSLKTSRIGGGPYQRSQCQSRRTSRIGGVSGPSSSVGHSVPGAGGGAEPEGVKPPSVFPCHTTC